MKIENKAKNDKISDKRVDCPTFILNRAEQLDAAFCYRDLRGPFSYGTLRNVLGKLRKNQKILKLPKENPTRFILPEWASRPEYMCIIRNDKKSIAVKFDFLSFLEGLSWEPIPAMHDLKLSFQVYSLRWLGSGWDYCARNSSYRRNFQLSYPVNVQCFNTGTVLVSIKASFIPFRLDPVGLLSLSILLGETRNSLRANCIPEPSSWTIVQCHLNRDSEPLSFDGLSFHVTFQDFFDNTARIYFKHTLEKVRAEVVLTPGRSFKDVFESILNRDEIPQEMTSKKEES